MSVIDHPTHPKPTKKTQLHQAPYLINTILAESVGMVTVANSLFQQCQPAFARTETSYIEQKSGNKNTLLAVVLEGRLVAHFYLNKISKVE